MYQLNEAEMFFDMTEGVAVVINFATGEYYGTTPLGSEVLNRFLKGNSKESILKALSALKGCPANFSEILDQFEKQLLEKHILIPGPAAAGGDEPIDESLSSDGFDMELNEYKEVQDLLLADPVHEVEEDAGWPNLKK